MIKKNISRDFRRVLLGSVLSELREKPSEIYGFALYAPCFQDIANEVGDILDRIFEVKNEY